MPKAAICRAEMEQKALDAAGADKLNAKLEAIWPELRGELAEFTVPVAVRAMPSLRPVGLRRRRS